MIVWKKAREVLRWHIMQSLNAASKFVNSGIIVPACGTETVNCLLDKLKIHFLNSVVIRNYIVQSYIVTITSDSSVNCVIE